MYGLILSVKRATRRNAAVLTANDKCSAIHCGGKTMACRHSWLGTLHTTLNTELLTAQHTGLPETLHTPGNGPMHTILATLNHTVLNIRKIINAH